MRHMQGLVAYTRIRIKGIIKEVNQEPSVHEGHLLVYESALLHLDDQRFVLSHLRVSGGPGCRYLGKSTGPSMDHYPSLTRLLFPFAWAALRPSHSVTARLRTTPTMALRHDSRSLFAALILRFCGYPGLPAPA